MNERNPQIDALKGWAIFLVILGHTIFWIDQTKAGSNLIFNIVYTFHVPLFFFVSGYLVYGRFGPTTLTWIKKKFMGIIIPYIIFTFVYFYIRPGDYLSQITLENLVYYMFSYTKPDSAWFLPVLFESFVVLSFIINIEKTMKKISFIPFLILFFIAFPLLPINSIPGGSQLVHYPIYVVIGYYVSKYKENIFKIKNDKNTYMNYSFLIIGFLLFPVAFSLRSQSIFNSIYFKIILAFTGMILSYFIIKLLKDSKFFSLFALCGVYSLELYLIHLLVGFYSGIFNLPIWFGSGMVKIISGTLIILALSLIISYILTFNKKISKTFFGRSSYKYAPEEKNQISFVLILTIGYIYILNRLFN